MSSQHAAEHASEMRRSASRRLDGELQGTCKADHLSASWQQAALLPVALCSGGPRTGGGLAAGGWAVQMPLASASSAVHAAVQLPHQCQLGSACSVAAATHGMDYIESCPLTPPSLQVGAPTPRAPRSTSWPQSPKTCCGLSTALTTCRWAPPRPTPTPGTPKSTATTAMTHGSTLRATTACTCGAWRPLCTSWWPTSRARRQVGSAGWEGLLRWGRCVRQSSSAAWPAQVLQTVTSELRSRNRWAGKRVLAGHALPWCQQLCCISGTLFKPSQATSSATTLACCASCKWRRGPWPAPRPTAPWQQRRQQSVSGCPPAPAEQRRRGTRRCDCLDKAW